MKERLTVTIDKDVIHLVDHYVDGIDIKNRSHAIEVLLKKSLNSETATVALILAGGRGTRLGPITREIPKPMVPIQGKTLLEHIFDLLRKHNITNIILSIGYLGNKIKSYYKNGSKFGVKITYVEESEPLGTAGPIKLAEKYLKGNFIVLNADELKSIDLTDMLQFHKERDSDVTIALTTVEDTHEYGAVDLKGDKILRFIEKPSESVMKNHSNLINAGLYVMNTKIIDLIPDGFCSLENDIFPKLAKTGKLLGYSFPGSWYPIDTPDRYEVAIDKWKGIASNTKNVTKKN